MDPILLTFSFVFGACIGSFLNVCIARWPKEESVVSPGSHCPHCQTPIKWYNNLPVLTYFILQGRCKDCKESISPRYVAVEVLTGLIFAVVFYFYGLTAETLAYWFMLSCFVVAIFTDFAHRIIPDQITIGGMWCGVVLSGLAPQMHNLSTQHFKTGQILFWVFVAISVLHWLTLKLRRKLEDGDTSFLVITISLFTVGIYVCTALSIWAPFGEEAWLAMRSSLIGAFVAGGSIYVMGVIGDLIFRKETMGGGDIKLLAMIGAFIGFKYAILAFFIAPFFGAAYGIVEKIRTKDSHIPYGPFLILGAFVAKFYGDRILHFIIYGS